MIVGEWVNECSKIINFNQMKILFQFHNRIQNTSADLFASKIS